MELFYPLSLFVFASLVFLSHNPIYGVLSFIVAVTHVVVLLIALDLEFFGYVLAIVYIGAIVVLFLFVIMMFYFRQSKIKHLFVIGLIEYFLLGCFVAFILELYSQFCLSNYADFAQLVSHQELPRLVAYLLFNEFALMTIVVALVMFIGIIGAIILTMKTPAFICKPNRTNIIRNKIQDSIKKFN